MGRNIATSHLPQSEVTTAYQFMLSPSMRNQLCGTSLSRKECETVNRSYLPHVLSKMGEYQATHPFWTAIPREIGIYRYFHGTSDQPTDTFYRPHSTQQRNQEPLNNLDEEPSADYRFWKTDLWVQLLSHREMLRKVVDHQSLAILEVNQGNNSRRQRVDTTSSKGKRYLYHGDFQPSKHEISPKELRCLNACRIYLQTLTLADMCDSSGRVVCSNILKGARHIDCRSQCNWANQAPPPLADAWLLWNRAVRKAFCQNMRGSPRLKKSLGKWLYSNPLHQSWDNAINIKDNNLIRRSQGSKIVQIHLQLSSP